MPYKDREMRLAYLREYHKKKLEENPNYNKELYQANAEKYRLAHTEWKRLHPKRIKELWRAYQIRNPKQICATQAKRRARKLQATPKWLSKEQLEEIRQIYLNCPNGFHVDHIHPLRGEGFCGLHVPWNLQYLSARENIMKGNQI